MKKKISAVKHVKQVKQVKQEKQEKQEKTFPIVGLHNLKAPEGVHKKRKLLGRGSSSGHGKTSTRGSKGQTSRAGRDYYLGFEGGQTPLIRRIPKRGFTSKFRKIYQIVNLEALEAVKDTTINPEVLLAKGFIKNKTQPVKILGNGTLTQPKTFFAHAFSKKAIEKIKNIGGTFEVLNA
jgi:large subunit ribosomal protein L15